MPLVDLHHVGIRCKDVETSERFYTEVLGMAKVDRPNFDFPGAWLQMGTTMFHLMGGYAAQGPNGDYFTGSAAVDHLAINARQFDAMRQRLESFALKYRENNIVPFGIWQLFVDDPDGIVIELNFRKADEPAESEGPRRAGLSKPF
jgi:catechol 2,3-dioxygenase-like lactoylglutathione lyase family enzyme